MRALYTGSAVEAWRRFTFVNIDFTVSSGESAMTMTGIIQYSVFTVSCAGPAARIAGTIVDITLAMSSFKAGGGAVARERVHQIHTDATVQTWIAGTFVNIRLALVALEAFQTLALERADFVPASGPVHTWIGRAFVDIQFAC